MSSEAKREIPDKTHPSLCECLSFRMERSEMRNLLRQMPPDGIAFTGDVLFPSVIFLTPQ